MPRSPVWCQIAISRRCKNIAPTKNIECEKPRKHLQRMRQQIELTRFNKLSPSMPAEYCHNLVYWFIRKSTHMCRHYGVKYMKIRFRLLHLIFLASFFLTKHKYNLYLPTPLKSSSSSKSFFRLTGESLEVAIHLNDIFLLIKKPCVTDYVYERQVSFNQLVNNRYLKCDSLKSPDHFSSRCWSTKLASISSSHCSLDILGKAENKTFLQNTWRYELQL